MAVICPNCNRSNNPLDETCSFCGHRLIPKKDSKCAQCGALNSVSNVFCDNCGARLGPASRQPDNKDSSKSLPGKEVSREQAPDWLTSLRATIHDEEPESTIITQPSSIEKNLSKTAFSESDGDENIPDWLREISEPPLTSDDTQDLTRDRPVTGEIPDWLREVLEKQSAIPPEESDQTSLTDVLLTLPKSDLEIIESGELPEWLSSLSPKIEGEQTETMPRVEKPIRPARGDDKTELSKEPDRPAAKPPKADISNIKKGSGSLAQSDWLDEPFMWTQQVDGLSEEDDSSPLGLPEWLQELGLEVPDLAQPKPLIVEDEHEELAPEPPPTAHRQKRDKKQSKSLTDWLGATTAPIDNVDKPKSDTISELPGTGPLGPPELPDWLAAVSTPAKTAELPSWLTQEFTSPPTSFPIITPEEEEDNKESTFGPLPSWLTEEDAGIDLEKSGPAKDQGTSTVDLPEWLEEAAKGRSEPAPVIDELPYWRLEQSKIDATLAHKDSEIQADSQGLYQAEIPEWLQALRPREASTRFIKPKPAISAEPAESSGPLKGLRGALAAADAAAVPPKRSILPRFVITEQQQANEKVATQIVQPEAMEKPKIDSQKRQHGWFEQNIISIIILIVVIISAIPQLNLTLPFSISDLPESAVQRDAFSLVDGLRDSALVIAAFDLTPASYGELEPLTRIFIKHLMEKNARIITVSTTPTGPQIAQSVMEKSTINSEYRYSQDYLNLGYIPGGAAGLQAFAANPWAVFPGYDYKQQELSSKAPAASGLGSSLTNVDLALVFTADQDDLVNWLEQVGQFSGFKAPIAAGSSASLEAWAQPYYYNEPRQLSGLVSGITDAAWYEKQVNANQTGEATRRGNNQVIGLITIILFITVGLLSSTLAWLVRRRSSNG